MTALLHRDYKPKPTGKTCPDIRWSKKGSFVTPTSTENMEFEATAMDFAMTQTLRHEANTVCWALNPNGLSPGTFLCGGASSTTTTTTTAAPSSTTTSTTTTAAPSSTTTSTTKSTLPPSTTTQAPSTTSLVSSPGVPVCPGTLLSAWNSCSRPSQYNCCPGGYGCYRQDQWYSQCVPVGKCHFSDCTCLGSACLGGTVSTTTAPTSTTSTTSTSTAPTSTATSTSTAAGTTTSSQASTTTSTTTTAPATSSTTTSAPTSSISTTASTPATTGPANPGTAAQVLAVYDTTSPDTILTSQRPDLSWGPSKVYKWEDFLKPTKNMYETGVGASKLWLGDGSANGITYGVVNLAAFLAQSMKETIQYDVCDENNWDQTSGYAATNACGQLGQSYQDYHCPPGEEHMECPLDPTMTIRAATSATWYGAPPPMFCAPKSKLPAAPKWNYGSPWCDPKVVRDYDMTPDEYIAYLKDPSKKCTDYPGQKAGDFEWCGSAGCPNNAAPAFGQPARTDLENCCCGAVV
eukprot:g2588.t1